ncbi:hypothetical protein XELAEV_18008412mg [Xenopus laevis]|uniref:Helix-turn-helix domain-containing protein n=1 Tax=Xenopus laevis TaxID=8355 RepID=A0A974I5C7_XENLA|nr:hypothetical protein XELAEV_18008412mg [Xenopus laevis]
MVYCCIDDCIIIWRGTETLLKEFIQDLNNNNFNLKSVTFLDLNIYVTTGGLQTRLFKKETDCNGYIPYSSGHHRKWLNNIHKGQFGRIKKNCSDPKDYQSNCKIMEGEFIEKGYNPQLLIDSKKKIDEMDRTELFATKTKKKELQFVPFITKFSKGGYKLNNIIKKHWHVLQMDKDLQGIIGEHPSFIFTRPNTLQQSFKDREKQTNLAGKQQRFFRCMQYIACKTLKNERQVQSFKSNQTNKQYKINQLITCETVNVVYLLECPCKKQYVGRTTRKLKLRIGEHIRNIKNGLKTHRGTLTKGRTFTNVSEHFLRCHNNDPSGLRVIGISNKVKNWRGGDNVQIISQEETRWIITLKTLQPYGLNVDLDINCFI